MSDVPSLMFGTVGNLTRYNDRLTAFDPGQPG